VSERLTPERLAVYLSPGQRAVLNHLAEEYAGEVHPIVTDDLEAVVDEAEEDTTLDEAVTQLQDWDLLDARSQPTEDGRTTRYMLTERGKSLFTDTDATLDDLAKPPLEWSPDEVAAAPMEQSKVLRQQLRGTVDIAREAIQTTAALEARIDALEATVESLREDADA
jgi:DNA-binding MarR family transcriptional regulator